jgi:hypothetical protein
MIGNSYEAMAQYLSLNEILLLQEKGDPIYVDEVLNEDRGWISDFKVFDGDFREFYTYEWFRASPGEEFEPKEKDLLSIHKNEPYDLVVFFDTEIEPEYSNILQEVILNSNFELSEDKSIEELAYVYIYKSEDQVLVFFKPLVPNYDGNRFRHAIIVYSRKDYDKGYRIK